MKKLPVLWFFVISAALSGCSTTHRSSLNLDEKLAREYQRYDSAQQLVLTRYKDPAKPVGQPLIQRAEWEAALAPPADEALTPDELVALKARQTQRVQAARDVAINASLIDFAAWRSLPPEERKKSIRAFCAAVPKGGMLHIHPWGTLNQATTKTLLTRSNPTIPAAEMSKKLSDPSGRAYLYPSELAWLNSLPAKATFHTLPVADRDRLVTMGELPPGTHPFERFEAVFNFVGLAVGGDWDNLVTLYRDFAQRAVRDGVRYVEFTGSMSPEEVPRYVHLADQLANDYGLTVRYNIAFNRTGAVADQNAKVRDMLQRIDSPYVTGIDLLANEDHTPALETGQAVYGPVLAAARLKGAKWHRTMHAGELGDVRNPRDAMLLGAERLGHGVRLIEDPVTLQYAAQKHIPIEINLTSNLKLRAIDDIRNHPYLTYLRLGLPVSLSTDDEGIFGIDINDDCALAVGQTDVTYYEYKEMAFNSIRTSFAAEDVKQKLLGELTARFDRFESGMRQPARPAPGLQVLK